MKKFVAIVLSALMVCALFANGTEETASAGFKPTKDVSWVCTSKPGGGSDIFTTQIKDAMKVNGITDANIVTEYITDGSGEVGRLQVSTTNKAKADYSRELQTSCYHGCRQAAPLYWRAVQVFLMAGNHGCPQERRKDCHRRK